MNRLTRFLTAAGLALLLTVAAQAENPDGKGPGGNDQLGQRALVELYLPEKQLSPPVLGHKIGLALEL